MAAAVLITYICAVSDELFQQIEQILSVRVFGKALSTLLQFGGCDPATGISNLFGASDLKALAL